MAQNPRTSDASNARNNGRNTPLTRRSYVQSLAAVATAAVSVGAAGTAAASEEYEVIEASGQTIQIGEGESLENTLIDLTTGDTIDLMVEGGNSAIRNVGFKGLYRGANFQISISAPSGEVLIENVYLGDGATKEGADHEHGPGGVFFHKEAGSDVTFRYCNVQGYPNNGFYCSNTESGGSVTFENCYGKNNGVSTFRCAGSDDSIHNCVAYNDDTDYGQGQGGYVEEHGRPVWVWSPGPVTIEDSHFAAGPYSDALVTHQGGSIEFESGAYSGGTQGQVQTGDVADDPKLSMPDGVPESAEEAANGD
ncbi:hypothetical protein [Natronococcus wangiae]|uniref:hypothetical protein n=1 Tax=Natronococcus wangiae TaxID=3068275 RepID=UPI00387EA91F